MATFNQRILDYYFKTRNWTGAADYLSTLSASTQQQQDELDVKINELRRRGYIQESMLQKMNSKQQEAFNFVSAYDGNTPLPQNSYGSKYSDILNNLKVTTDVITTGGRNVKGEHISTLRIELNTDAEYNRYLSKLGLTEDTIKNEDVSVKKDSSTGNWVVDVPMNNKQVPKFYGSAIDLDEVIIHNSSVGALTQYVKGKYSIKGITSSNIIVGNNQFNAHSLNEAYGILNVARREQQKAIEENQTISTLEKIVVTPFLGHGHANAYKRMSKGMISIDDYNKIVEERTEVYNRLLRQAGLENYKVYTNEEDDEDTEGKVFKEIANKDKDKIMQQILIAMDDKRLTYSAAMLSGEVGTYITISGATDKDKNLVSGEYGQPIRIFIPGLFKSSCDESFNADPKQAAVRDNADMRRWNYGKTLKDGNYVGYDKEIGAYIQSKDENGELVKVPISEAQMLQYLNKENILDKSVRELSHKVDDEGKPLVYNKNGKQQTYNIEEEAQTTAINATNELYPKGAYNDGQRLQYANDMYNIIMKELTNKIYKRQQN